MIVVDEGAVKIQMTGNAGFTRRASCASGMPNILVLCRFSRYEDGYGFTYGARLTLPDPNWMGKRSRITFPLTLGRHQDRPAWTSRSASTAA